MPVFIEMESTSGVGREGNVELRLRLRFAGHSQRTIDTAVIIQNYLEHFLLERFAQGKPIVNEEQKNLVTEGEVDKFLRARRN